MEMIRLPDNTRWQSEYESIVADILRNQEFLQLANFDHHGGSILEHCKSVSHLSYSLCRRLGLDYVAAARGGLLHDFFLYDWRLYKRDKRNPNHGLNHPRVALANAMRHFKVSKKEKDIILKHMVPKLWGLPRYLESWIVSLVDKYLAVQEFLAFRHHQPGPGR
jgi:uncharacterized protein